MKRVVSLAMAVLLISISLFGCTGYSLRKKTLLEPKRISGSSVKENHIKEFSMAYMNEKGEYETDKVFSFTEGNGITFRRALVKNGYFYVNTNISNENYPNPADATVKFSDTLTGDKLYEKWNENKDKMEQIDDLTFYECDNSNSGFTAYYSYKLVKNDATKESKASTSEFSKYARYVVAETKMYIFTDYKTGRYMNYTEDDYKNEVIKIAGCISQDKGTAYICDIGCLIDYNGISCNNYVMVKEIGAKYLLLKYDELVSVRVEATKDEEAEQGITADAYLENLLANDKSSTQTEILGLKAAASEMFINIPFNEGNMTTVTVYNLAAGESTAIEDVVAFVNTNMLYNKKAK